MVGFNQLKGIAYRVRRGARIGVLAAPRRPINFVEKAGIKMTTIIIRRDEPEEQLIFPARRSPRKVFEKIPFYELNVYDTPAILESTRTNVRDVSPPKS